MSQSIPERSRKRTRYSLVLGPGGEGRKTRAPLAVLTCQLAVLTWDMARSEPLCRSVTLCDGGQDRQSGALGGLGGLGILDLASLSCTLASLTWDRARSDPL
jgi:hypothetical protein